MQNSTSFKPEYITIPLIVIVSIVSLLTLFTGHGSMQETVSFILTIALLSFLASDLKKGSFGKRSPHAAYKYVLLVFLFSFLTLM
ncbi:hypothetical protein AAEO50_05190 [Rossellomorea oryzaecorticis]|uniref:Uncharacterized protein n=1 Tax=Rossellomorea oryzaecorticis TaxID=1396505 RepID=A0ABU9K6F5_9BACI